MNYCLKFKILCWNVCGLNEKDKRIAIRKTILLENPNIVCLQETKLSQIDDNLIKQICGLRFKKYVIVDAVGTRGGYIIILQ